MEQGKKLGTRTGVNKIIEEQREALDYNRMEVRHHYRRQRNEKQGCLQDESRHALSQEEQRQQIRIPQDSRGPTGNMSRRHWLPFT